MTEDGMLPSRRLRRRRPRQAVIVSTPDVVTPEIADRVLHILRERLPGVRCALVSNAKVDVVNL